MISSTSSKDEVDNTGNIRDEVKALTPFRSRPRPRRRLSLTSSSVAETGANTNASTNEDEEGEKKMGTSKRTRGTTASVANDSSRSIHAATTAISDSDCTHTSTTRTTGRGKRRLSATTKNRSISSSAPNFHRRLKRRLHTYDETSTSTATTTTQPLLSCLIMHAPGLSNHLVNAATGGDGAASAAASSTNALSTVRKKLKHPPRWMQRHVVTMDDQLPFQRHVVGIFSHHGMEPVYDCECEEENDHDHDHDHDDGDEAVDVLSATVAITVDEDSSSLTPKKRYSDTSKTKTPPAVYLQSPRSIPKINQDRGGIAFPYGNCSTTALFAVYDGHGHGGELISQFALSEVQRRLALHPTFPSKESFVETLTNVDQLLKKEPLIESFFAGTTACIVLMRDHHLIIANVGDSRAVVARRTTSTDAAAAATTRDCTSYCTAMTLTEDQKPDTPAELERIQRLGGFVSAPPAPGLSARVWLDAECSQIGLAMSRSIGDHSMSAVGVTSEPVVTYHTVDANDEFLILASDGVWEFLNSQEAVDVVAHALSEGDNDATKACQALIEAAAVKWHEEEESAYRDDITAIVVRLQHVWKSENNRSSASYSILTKSPPSKRQKV